MSGIISTTSSDPVTALLLRAATDPSFNAEKFEVAVNFLREREATQARRAFNEAMSRAQAEMREVHRDAKNDHLRSRYATLSGMLQTILPAASRHGLNVRFGSAPASQPGWQCVTCIVSLGDHVETTSLEGPIVNTGAAGGRTQMTAIQATGSTTTYLKRYVLGMIFAIVLSDEQDDDGEATRYVHTEPRQSPPPSRPPVPLTPPAPRQTAAQWLDETASELAAAQTDAAVNAILDRPRYKQMRDWLTNGARDRLLHLEQEAITRIAVADDAAEAAIAPEEADGLYADPATDPFLQPARETA